MMFTKIGQLAKLMWAGVFHPDDVDSMGEAQAKVFDQAKKNFGEQLKSAGAPQGPSNAGAPGAEGSAAAPGSATATVMTLQQKADAAVAAQKALNDELFEAAKSLQTRISEMRDELLKKDATDVKGYLAGLAESFKPLYDQIDKVKQDFRTIRGRCRQAHRAVECDQSTDAYRRGKQVQ